MWKKLCSGVLLIPALTLAEPVKVDKPIVCDDLVNVIKYVMKDYDEVAVWFGMVREGTTAGMFVNPQTTTWSFVTAVGDRGCLIESGIGFQLKALPPPKREEL